MTERSYEVQVILWAATLATFIWAVKATLNEIDGLVEAILKTYEKAHQHVRRMRASRSSEKTS